MTMNLNEDYLSFEIPNLEEFFHAVLDPKILEKAMMAALDEVENQVKLNFSLRQQSWQSLAPSTQRERARQGFNPQTPILVRSGVLKDNAAKGREIEITGNELRGDVFPFDDAKTNYSDTPLGDYIERLNAAREFYSLEESQIDIVYGVFVDVISQELGLV